MKVVWTMNALERLQETEYFISQNSPETAVRFIDKLIERGSRVGSFPNAGRQVPELESSEIREILESGYRIVYRVRPKHIEILTVFEGHRQFPKEDISQSE